MHSLLDMKIKLILLSILLISLFSPAVYAIRVSGLYQTAVPVTDESASYRNAAIKQALIQVLVKLTGDRNVQRSFNIEPLLERPERFVQQFRYHQISSEDATESPSVELRVKFDETALNEALRSYGIAVWSNERPAIVVWLAHEGMDGRQIVSFEERPEYLEILDQRASARGVPLLFPLLDLEDASRINVSDVWAGFKEPVTEASRRYDADVILTGKLVQIMPSLWEANWTVYINNDVLTWSNQGNVADMVIEEGVDGLADRLASRQYWLHSGRDHRITSRQY